MIGEIAQNWERVETHKAQILARVKALDEKSQRTAPNARVWSPLQIVQHLILVETEYLHFIAEGERQGVATKRPSRSPMIPFIIWMMRKRISFPTLPTMEPPVQTKPLPELTAEWDTVRGKLRENIRMKDPETPIALNPLMGPLNAVQILTLMEAHHGYHLQQIPSN